MKTLHTRKSWTWLLALMLALSMALSACGGGGNKGGNAGGDSGGGSDDQSPRENRYAATRNGDGGQSKPSYADLDDDIPF